MSIGRTRRSSQSGPSVSMVPDSRRTRTAVIFIRGSPWLRGHGLSWAELRLGDHAFMAILHVLHPILQIAPLVRQRALDRIGTRRHMPFQPIRHEMHGLSDLELMTRHDDPFPPAIEEPHPLDDNRVDM